MKNWLLGVRKFFLEILKKKFFFLTKKSKFSETHNSFRNMENFLVQQKKNMLKNKDKNDEIINSDK